jgi:hypothetical protein
MAFDCQTPETRLRPARVDPYVVAIGPAELLQPLHECGYATKGLGIIGS